MNLENEIQTTNKKLPQNDEIDRLKMDLESLHIKCKKYDENNFNLKLELDKLYEEIETYDKEITNLKGENMR